MSELKNKNRSEEIVKSSMGSSLSRKNFLKYAGASAYNSVGHLIEDPNYLLQAGKIVSVEARHAARVRQLRGLTGWISGGPDDQNVPQAAQAVYAGDPSPPETNTTQVVSVTDTLSGDGDVDSGDIAEAWDEPFTMDEVLAIASLFIVDNS